MWTLLVLIGVASVSAHLQDLSFDGQKVFRVIPQNDEQVEILNFLARIMEVDFWQPDSVTLVRPKMQVDFRVEAEKTYKVEDLTPAVPLLSVSTGRSALKEQTSEYHQNFTWDCILGRSALGKSVGSPVREESKRSSQAVKRLLQTTFRLRRQRELSTNSSCISTSVECF